MFFSYNKKNFISEWPGENNIERKLLLLLGQENTVCWELLRVVKKTESAANNTKVTFNLISDMAQISSETLDDLQNVRRARRDRLKLLTDGVAKSWFNTLSGCWSDRLANGGKLLRLNPPAWIFCCYIPLSWPYCQRSRGTTERRLWAGPWVSMASRFG